MKYIALDFETANEKRSSPCSLGITIFEDGKPIEEHYWLIRPYEIRFEPINIMIHGIRPSDVLHEKEFHKLWPEVYSYLKGNLVIAHNASFDMSVLRATLELYNIPFPELSYACTMIMSKQFYPFLENAKLDTVNRHLGFEFSHHHASADATACGNILAHIIEELQVDTIEELLSQLGMTIGTIFEHGYKPCRKKTISKVSKIASKETKKHFSSNPNLLKGRYVTLTGPLKTMSRYEAIDLIYELGGIYTSSVTKKTNLVITNTPNPNSLSPDQMSKKLRKAIMLIEKGQKIEIRTEDIFFES